MTGTRHSTGSWCDSYDGRLIDSGFDYPPIPDRRFDWAAWFKGDPEGIQGRGPTKAAAIDNLIELYEELRD